MMELITLFTLVTVLAWCTGINPYGTLLMLAILVKASPHTGLPVTLAFVENDIFFAVILFLALLHFFADMVPGIDSGWDLFHTVIRIPLGVLIAAQVVKGHSDVYLLLAAFAGLLLSALSHLTKSSIRASINTQATHLLNWLVAPLEVMLVVVMMWLSIVYPLVALAALVVQIAVSMWLLPRYWRDFHHLAIHTLLWLRRRKGWRENDTFFD